VGQIGEMFAAALSTTLLFRRCALAIRLISLGSGCRPLWRSCPVDHRFDAETHTLELCRNGQGNRLLLEDRALRD
jgi:hypothetical protein